MLRVRQEINLCSGRCSVTAVTRQARRPDPGENPSPRVDLATGRHLSIEDDSGQRATAPSLTAEAAFSVNGRIRKAACAARADGAAV